MPSTSLQQATEYISIYTTKHIYVIRNNLNNRSSIYREGEQTSVVKVNWSQGRVAEGIGVREEDDTGAGGVRGGGGPRDGKMSPPPPRAGRVHAYARGEDDNAAVERMHNGSWRGTQVFSEERIDTGGDIFILLKHINTGSPTRTAADKSVKYRQQF
jgi:hypothetical protein